MTKDMTKTGKAIVILKTDGKIKKVAIKNDDELLTALQKAVGGYIEVAEELNDYLAVIANEEGWLKELKPNAFFPQYVGDLAICGVGWTDDGWDLKPLEDEQVKQITRKDMEEND